MIQSDLDIVWHLTEWSRTSYLWEISKKTLEIKKKKKERKKRKITRVGWLRVSGWDKAMFWKVKNNKEVKSKKKVKKSWRNWRSCHTTHSSQFKTTGTASLQQDQRISHDFNLFHEKGSCIYSSLYKYLFVLNEYHFFFCKEKKRKKNQIETIYCIQACKCVQCGEKMYIFILSWEPFSKSSSIRLI